MADRTSSWTAANATSTSEPRKVESKKPSTEPTENTATDQTSDEVISEEGSNVISGAKASGNTTTVEPRSETTAPQGTSTVQVNPYLWIAGISGRAGIGNRSADVHSGVADTSVHINFGFMGAQSIASQREKSTFVTNPSPFPSFTTKITEVSERESTDPQISDARELALKLHNPIADLITVPIESDFEFTSGSRHTLTFTLNVQPVIPFKLTKDWLLVTRTIVPLIEVVAAGDRHKVGLGDITQSFFLSPAKLVGSWTVGAGPVFQYPTATDSVLGAGRWGAGPTAAALRQNGGWTFGVLANHIWSFAGDRRREKVDTSLVDPFISYTWKNDFTVEFDGESTFDWQLKKWTVPLTAGVSRLLTLGKQSVSVGLDGRWYAERVVDSPKWGVVSTVTFLFTR